MTGQVIGHVGAGEWPEATTPAFVGEWVVVVCCIGDRGGRLSLRGA